MEELYNKSFFKPEFDKYGNVTNFKDLKGDVLIFDFSNSINCNKKEKIHTIDSLKKYLEKLINVAFSKYSCFFPYTTPHTKGDIDIVIQRTPLDKDIKNIIVNQLVIDVLFQKYTADQKKHLMVRSDYAQYMEDAFDLNYDSDAIRKAIERSMNKYADMIENTDLKNQVKSLEMNPEKYIEYYMAPKKDSLTHSRPKYLWDYFFYNSYLLSSVQYDRSKLKPTTKSVNYSYSQKINDIIEYCEFEDKLLSPNRIVYNKWKKDTPFIEKDSHEESAEDYFIKMMEYYYLESYKRVDFMLKYAINLKDIPEHEIEEKDKYIWVLKRFCPKIACPKIGPKNNIIYTVRYHYYKPILFAEEKIIKDSFIDKKNIIEKTFIDLNFYQILRAYAYEAFIFYAQFESDDYEDIRNFLMSSYDLRYYHQSTGIKEHFNSNMNKHEMKEAKQIIRKFIKFNTTLFPDNPNRKKDISQK